MAKTDIQPGFFVSADSTHVVGETLDVGKNYMLSRISTFVELHPSTEKKNINTVTDKINACNNTTQLTKLLWDLILAHPSENLKVIK